MIADDATHSRGVLIAASGPSKDTHPMSETRRLLDENNPMEPVNNSPGKSPE